MCNRCTLHYPQRKLSSLRPHYIVLKHGQSKLKELGPTERYLTAQPRRSRLLALADQLFLGSLLTTPYFVQVRDSRGLYSLAPRSGASLYRAL